MLTCKTIQEHGIWDTAMSVGGILPLQVAASKGHHDMVQYLLDKNAAVEATGSSEKSTALALAIQRESLPTVKLLLERGASIDRCNHEPLTMKQYLAHIQDFELFELCIKNMQTYLPLEYLEELERVCANQGREKHVKFLRTKIDKSARKTTKLCDGGFDNTALDLAVMRGRHEVYKVLKHTPQRRTRFLKQHRTMCPVPVEGEELLYAAKSGRVDAVRYFLCKTGEFLGHLLAICAQFHRCGK